MPSRCCFPENDGHLRCTKVKLLIQNQMLDERTDSRSEPATDETPGYISCYINGYGRP